MNWSITCLQLSDDDNIPASDDFECLVLFGKRSESQKFNLQPQKTKPNRSREFLPLLPSATKIYSSVLLQFYVFVCAEFNHRKCECYSKRSHFVFIRALWVQTKIQVCTLVSNMRSFDTCSTWLRAPPTHFVVLLSAAQRGRVGFDVKLEFVEGCPRSAFHTEHLGEARLSEPSHPTSQDK